MAASYLGQTADELFSGIRQKSRAHLARAISIVEDGSQVASELLALAYTAGGNARVTGITGAPGVGKSSLVDGIVSRFRALGRTVGVVAVDPSSPFTGGAILGDRVRMRSHTTDPGVFFRSLATRGHLGGLSRHTGDVIALMDAFGFDEIVIETVGAGQSEVDIMKYADSVVVVLAPGLGDDVQAIKAGILEIGDVFCVNKADMPDAERTVREIEMMLNLKEPQTWRPRVVETVATTGRGLDALIEAIEAHRGYLHASGLIKTKTRDRHRAVVEEYLKHMTVEAILEQASADGTLDRLLDDMSRGALDPMDCALRLVKMYGPKLIRA